MQSRRGRLHRRRARVPTSARSAGCRAASPTRCSTSGSRRKPRARCWPATTRSPGPACWACGAPVSRGCRSTRATRRQTTSRSSTASTARCCSSKRHSPPLSPQCGPHCPRPALDLHRRRRLTDCPSLDGWIAIYDDTAPMVDYAPDDVVAVMPTGGHHGEAQRCDEHPPQLPDPLRQFHDHLQLPRRRTRREPRRSTDDTHRRRALAAVHGARWHRRGSRQARAGRAPRRHRAAPRHRAVPASDGHLPAPRRAGNSTPATFRRCATSSPVRHRCPSRSSSAPSRSSVR